MEAVLGERSTAADVTAMLQDLTHELAAGFKDRGAEVYAGTVAPSSMLSTPVGFASLLAPINKARVHGIRMTVLPMADPVEAQRDVKWLLEHETDAGVISTLTVASTALEAEVAKQTAKRATG